MWDGTKGRFQAVFQMEHRQTCRICEIRAVNRNWPGGLQENTRLKGFGKSLRAVGVLALTEKLRSSFIVGFQNCLM